MSDLLERIELLQEPTQASIGELVRRLLDEVQPGCQPSYEADPPAGDRRLSECLPLPGVAYLLPGLPPEGSGGSHSLVQEARGMRELGADARICVPLESLGTATDVYSNEDSLFTPYADGAPTGSASAASPLDAVEGAAVVIATEYPSVDLLARLARERPGVLCAYYVQDYEPLFAAPESSRSDRALLSYRAIPELLLFAKTNWLRGLVSALHGMPVAKVAPSLDRELFHARGRSESGAVLRLAAMIRPRTPRRRPVATLEALAMVASTLGAAVEISTFGCDDAAFARLDGPSVTGIRHLGLLSRQEVAELMRRCDMFLDGSAYQAFGRTGLEAMACGAVPVLPELGGVAEYAIHDLNAIVLEQGSPAQMQATVLELAREPMRLAGLRQAGLLAAEEFSVARAAASQLALFAAAIDARRVEGSP